MLREGIVVDRDTDVGVLLEKRSWLKIFKEIEPDHQSIFYPAADEEMIHITRDGTDISFLGAKGASFAANMTERLRVTGANPILRIGTCGALNDDVPLWQPIVTTACYRAEGTSGHYLDNAFPTVPDFDFSCQLIKTLKKHGLNVSHGISITTDGRWMEDQKFMQKLADQGVLSIEMETAAIFAVCQARRLISAAINIPTDYPLHHSEGGFKGVTDHKKFQDSLELTLRALFPAIIEVLLETRNEIIKAQK
jgi:uridine phosphorylase